MSKKVITEADVLRSAQSNAKIIQADPECVIVTPKARDKAEELGIKLENTCSLDDQNRLPDKPQNSQSSLASKNEPHADDLVRQVSKLLKPHLPEGVDHFLLQKIIKDTVNQKLSSADTLSAKPEKSSSRHNNGRVKFIRSDRLLDSTEAPLPVKDSVVVTEAINSGTGVSMAGGFMQWDSGSFKRKLTIPEMTIVIKGVLHLDVGGEQIKAEAGDMIYLPENIEVVYATPEGVRLACINCIS